MCVQGGDVLNVGFGLGIIDDAIQRRGPRSHTIVEAHPDVYAHIKALGWDARPGVRVVFGRWQDVVEQVCVRVCGWVWVWVSVGGGWRAGVGSIAAGWRDWVSPRAVAPRTLAAGPL